MTAHLKGDKPRGGYEGREPLPRGLFYQTKQDTNRKRGTDEKKSGDGEERVNNAT